MMWILVIFIALSNSFLGLLIYLLQVRLEKIEVNQLNISKWCDTLRKNQDTIMTDLKKVAYGKKNR